ncbi:MAG: transporter [Cyanobacteria bacterium QS_9_48_30]|nr:MAG: transporter [Cyanobacteria bacterium QS_9_48_30]
MSQSATKLETSLSPNSTTQAQVGESGNPLGEFVQETLALTKRLFIQLQRRPSTLIAGVIQPLMWLILFGALFYNAPEGLLGEGVSYGKFLAPGVIVFTAFSGALNAGLPVMFDREFGFINRLLVAPLVSRFSIVAASTIYIIALSFIQTAAIVAASAFIGAGLPSLAGLGAIALIVLLIVLGVTALSLGLAFTLPGHVELIAVIFVTNLPLLFASTAQPIRHIYTNADWALSSAVMQTPWGSISFSGVLLALLAFDALVLLAIQPLLRRRFA